MATKPRWQIVKEAREASGFQGSSAEFVRTQSGGNTGGNTVGTQMLNQRSQAQQAKQDSQDARGYAGAAAANKSRNQPTRNEIMKPSEPVPTPTEPGVRVSAKGGNAITETVEASVTPPALPQQPNQAVVPAVSATPVAPNPAVSGAVAAPAISGEVINTSQTPPNQSGEFNMEEFANADPYTQQMMAAQYEQQAAAAAGQAQLDPYKQLQERNLEEARALNNQILGLDGLTEDQEENVEQFEVKAEKRKEKAVRSVQKNADARMSRINDVLSAKGFARSTKRADLFAEIDEQVADDIADIETQTNEAVSNYEIEMLSRNEAKIKGVQDRLDDVYDQSHAEGFIRLFSLSSRISALAKK